MYPLYGLKEPPWCGAWVFNGSGTEPPQLTKKQQSPVSENSIASHSATLLHISLHPSNPLPSGTGMIMSPLF